MARAGREHTGGLVGAVDEPEVVAVSIERDEPLDPWQHRSQMMKCRTCMYFVPKKTQDGSGELGRCRRHAPVMGGYPAVFTHDWCGDHKLNEHEA